MNTMSLFGSAGMPAAWVQILLGVSALSMVSAMPEWRWSGRVPGILPAWLPVGGLLGLAVVSTIAGVMQPELLAAVFSEI